MNAWIGVYALIAMASWFAWYQAASDPDTIYLPLRSFFIPVESGFDLPSWTLALKFKPEFIYKLSHELLIWLILAAQITLLVVSYIKKLSMGKILKTSVAIAVLSIFIIPIDSSDLFAYVARGSQQVLFGQNPYSEVVSSIFNWTIDPMLSSTLWEANPSPYGPLFMLWCKLLVALSFKNIWLALFWFKALNALVFILLVFALVRFLQTKGFDQLMPDLCGDQVPKALQMSKEQVLIVLALNPFIINEVIWNGHNDILMAALIMIAIYAALNDKYNLAVFAVIMAALIKYIALVLLPIVILFSQVNLKNREPFNKAKGNLMGNLLTMPPLLGFLIASPILIFCINYYNLLHIKFAKITENLALSHKSLFDVFNSLNRYVFDADLPALFKISFLVLYALILAWIMYLIVRDYLWSPVVSRPRDQLKIKKAFLKYSFWVLFVLVSFISAKFHSWYILLYIVPGLLVEPFLMLMLSLAHMLSFTFLDQANIANYLIMTLFPVLYYYVNLKRRSLAT